MKFNIYLLVYQSKRKVFMHILLYINVFFASKSYMLHYHDWKISTSQKCSMTLNLRVFTKILLKNPLMYPMTVFRFFRRQKFDTIIVIKKKIPDIDDIISGKPLRRDLLYENKSLIDPMTPQKEFCVVSNNSDILSDFKVFRLSCLETNN